VTGEKRLGILYEEVDGDLETKVDGWRGEVK
jgi:hypothetical protein